MCQIWAKNNTMSHNVASLLDLWRSWLILSTEHIKLAGNTIQIHPIP